MIGRKRRGAAKGGGGQERRNNKKTIGGGDMKHRQSCHTRTGVAFSSYSLNFGFEEHLFIRMTIY